MNYGLKMPQQGSNVDAFGSYLPANYGIDNAPSYAPMVGQGMGMQAPGGALTPQFGGGSGGGNWWDGALGSTNAQGMKTDGWGGMALSTVSGLMNAYMGMKQYGLAKQTLAHNKDQFAKNYAAQKTTTNAAFEDRQRARVASNPGAYQSVGDYMKKNAIA